MAREGRNLAYAVVSEKKHEKRVTMALKDLQGTKNLEESGWGRRRRDCRGGREEKKIKTKFPSPDL